MEPAARGGGHHVRPVRGSPARDRLGGGPAGRSVPPRAGGAGEPVRRPPGPPVGYRAPRPGTGAGSAQEVRRARPSVHLLRLHRPLHRHLPRGRGVRPRVPDPRREFLRRLQALRGDLRSAAAPRRRGGPHPQDRLPAARAHDGERRHAAASADRRHRCHGIPGRDGPHRGDPSGDRADLLRQQRPRAGPLRGDAPSGDPVGAQGALVDPPADRLRVPRHPPPHEDDPHGDGNGERLPADFPPEGGASADPEHRGGGESGRRRARRFLLETAPLRGRVHQVRQVPGRMPGVRGGDAPVPAGRGPEDEGRSWGWISTGASSRRRRTWTRPPGSGSSPTSSARFSPRERSGRAPPAAPACRRVP